MILKFIKEITCTESIDCAELIRKKLETPQLKLMARTSTNSVNGSITISHVPNRHVIRIEIYDKDELPNKFHESTLKKPIQMPTKIQLNSLLDK